MITNHRLGNELHQFCTQFVKIELYSNCPRTVA